MRGSRFRVEEFRVEGFRVQGFVADGLDSTAVWFVQGGFLFRSFRLLPRAPGFVLWFGAEGLGVDGVLGCAGRRIVSASWSRVMVEAGGGGGAPKQPAP